MTDTFASLFSGGGLADIGAKQAGYAPLWGVEYEPKIADYYRRNLGEHIIVSKVQDVDYAALETPYWLHMSPPCINASQAKVVKDGVRETELDVEMARTCCKAIATLLPPMVSLENVSNYRSFKSFLLILRALHDNGYNYDFWILNSASYGVAQTRKRLILVASRVQRVRKPSATHRKAQKETGQLSLIPPLPNWLGWYGAIEDILHTLPDDEFSPWQLELLPPELKALVLARESQAGTGENYLCGNQQRRGILSHVRGDGHGMTITANVNQGSLRALLVGNAKGQRGYKHPDDAYSPAHTITGEYGSRCRAWLVPDENKWAGQRTELEPSQTIKHRTPLAFIVDGKANGRGSRVTSRDAEQRLFGVTSSTGHKETIRAYVGWRVARITPRALARFQSIPDSYELRGQVGLDCRVIGNAVPPLLMKCVIETNHER